jgi:Zn-dependent M28 family amino/carboxypeptidase
MSLNLPPLRSIFTSLLFFAVVLNFKAQKSDTILIKNHLINITKTAKFRNYQNLEQLNRVAKYIHADFSKYADKVSYQEFEVNSVIYKNVICSFGTENSKRIVVGAHYDVCGNQEGADDNASGVVGLLELARQLKGKKLKYRIDLVAYTLEEPPYYRTEFMGSFIHAKSLVEEKADVFGMISLEMIAYFKDEKNTQTYPIGLLKLFYGGKGNFITLVNKMHSGKFARKFSSKMKSKASVKIKKFKAPRVLPGIDYSDHRNYWHFGISALMITDTSFYRNFNYHNDTDTLETLDLKRMAKVIDEVLITLIDM